MNSLINWGAIQKLQQSNAPMKKVSKEQSAQMWGKVSSIYNFMAGLEKEFTLKQVETLILDSNDTVLDIGCGIGRLTLPVAKRVKKVTALDISDKMLDLCKKNTQEAGLDNVDFKIVDWNSVEIGKDIEKHDVAFASRTVALTDIIKLNNIAKKYAFVLSFAEYPSLRDIQLEMLEGIRGIKKRKVDKVKDRMFGYNVTFNILYDLGIDPMVNVVEDGFERIYESKEAAYLDLKHVIVEFGEDCVLTEEEETIFKNNIDKYLSLENGKYKFSRKTKTYIIGWKPIEL